VTPTDYQSRVLAFRGHCNILSAGARGTGKSTGLCLDVIDFCATYGQDANVLVCREQWSSLMELQANIYEMACRAFPGTTRNKAEGTVSCANGATIYFTNVNDEDSEAKIRGRSFGMIANDEIGNWPITGYLLAKRMRSNLRAPRHVQTRQHWTANPGGRLSNRLWKEFIIKSAPWTPFHEDPNDAASPVWIWTQSTLVDNPHLDAEKYLANLRAATAHDPALAKAWIDGEWGPAGGNLFCHFDPTVHIVEMAEAAPLPSLLKTCMSMDFGLSSPSVLLMGCMLTEQRGRFARGSIFVVDEYATVRDWAQPELGDGTPPVRLAEAALAMASKWGHRNKKIVVDDYRGLGGKDDTVTGILCREGLWAVKPSRKSRLGGFSKINQMLWAAKNGGPGLYFSPRARYLLDTLPDAPVDESNRGDISVKYRLDHAIDALNYLVQEFTVGFQVQGKIEGYY
jgi:hypothetical protein